MYSEGQQTWQSLSFCRTIVDCNRSVPSTSRNWIELKVLLEGLAFARRQVESLLFMVDGKIIEGRNQQDGEGEWNSGKTHLSCLDSTSVRNSDNCGAEKVVCLRDKGQTELFCQNLHSMRSGLAKFGSRVGVYGRRPHSFSRKSLVSYD